MSKKILLVEDNPGDEMLVKEAFNTGELNIAIDTAKNGEIAIDYLYKQGEFTSVSDPDLILLDINLPKKDGKQVLQEIKSDEKLRAIPVIMMSSSSAKNDVEITYGLNANAYIVKPASLAEFIKLVAAIESFWFSAVTLVK